jgi:glutamine amidotransferase
MTGIALIDYGSGNIRSAEKALLAAARRAGAPAQVIRTTDPEVVRGAERIVLHGQGAFADCMAGLEALPGMTAALEEAVLRRGAPFLGICVGMQLLAAKGLEHGETKGLGWIGGVCRPLRGGPSARIPHMGWNAATVVRPHVVFDALAPEAYVYFMHSFVLEPADPAAAATLTSHGESFVSAVARDNLVGVQFHPEKSQAAGLALLQRFIEWRP